MRDAHEIYTVFTENGSIAIGFIARRSVIFGIAQEIPDGWVTGQLDKNAIVFDSYPHPERAEAKKELRKQWLANKTK